MTRIAHVALAASLTLVPLAGRTRPIPPDGVSSLKPCRAADLTFHLDAEHGRFDGLFDDTKTGTLVVIRNAGSACALPVFSPPVATGPDHRVVPIVVDTVTPFSGPLVNGRRLSFGHGPVALPLDLEPGMEATTTIRWVRGAVDRPVCREISAIALEVNGEATESAPVDDRICGDEAAGLRMEIGRFLLDR